MTVSDKNYILFVAKNYFSLPLTKFICYNFYELIIFRGLEVKHFLCVLCPLINS